MENREYIPFGELLKNFRQKKRKKQQELALQLGVHRNTIGTWERGDRLPDTRGMVMEVAKCLQLDERETSCLLEASLTTIMSYWHVPYQRNPFFTGREQILQQLHEGLCQSRVATITQSFALSGLGGIGKTQTAIEYAYRYANDYTGIFWIGAETSESLVSDMIAIADLLSLPESQERDQGRIVAAVIRWLNSHGQWLLIFDNVEDFELVKGILPITRDGPLLFTSRRQALGFNTQKVDMEKMTSEEGMRFLLHRARLLDPAASLNQLMPADESAAREIVAAMDGLPLALDQAGAYIEAARCSLCDYLQILRSSELRLLEERDAHADHPLPVTKTFALAFERIERSNMLAAELLMACAYLAPEAIPEAFFVEGAPSLGPIFEALAADPFEFNTALKVLLAYSLIQRDAATHTLTIHRLVQAVLKGRLSQIVQNTWVTRVTHAITQLFPSEKTQVGYWQACERLLPHALVCITLSDQWTQDVVERVTLMKNVAMYLTYRARFAEAEPLYQRSVCIGEQALGLEHPLVAEAVHGWGSLYREQGRYKDAEPLYQRVLCIREHTLGLEHPLIGCLLISLALLHKEQGQYAQAEVEYQRSLRILEGLSGPERINIPGLLSNLADLYREQGRYEEAEPLLQRAVSLWEQTLGAEDINLVYPLHNLAEVYREQGKYEYAEPLYQRVLRNCEQALGPEHPLVAEPLVGLAALLSEKRQYDQAESLYQRALHIQEQVLGSEHPRVAYALQGWAALHVRQGRYEQAELLYQRALALRQQHLGPEHPLVAEILHDLARLRQMQRRPVKALSLYQQALTIRIQALGLDNPKTMKTRTCYAQLQKELGQAGGAEVSYDAAFPVEQSRAEYPACPSCQRVDAVVRSGVNRVGTRRFWCRFCQHYFTPERKIRGYDPSIKDQALVLAQEGFSARLIAQMLQVHHSTISIWIKENQRMRT